jgi:antimicrobial peptide system SdpB family protein
LFCVAEPVWGQRIAVVILLVVASGWRPRLTALPHWWATASFQASTTTADGGDQVAAVITLLMLPIALSDGRAWHWQRARPVGDLAVAVLAWSALVVIRVQVAGIYLQASMAKLGKQEWANGTALYYWLSDPLFGVPGWAEPLFGPVLADAAGVTILTWGTVAVEFALVFGLFARRAARPYLLGAGVLLHGSIALFMGLGSFALAMIACLVLYLRPLDRPWPAPDLLVRAIASLRSHLSAAPQLSWARRRTVPARGALEENRGP